MTLIRGISEQELPLCPVGPGQPGHELHQVANTILDAFNDAADTDPETGEFVSEEVDRAYTAASKAIAPMRLYRETIGYDMKTAGRVLHTTVQTHYLRCPVCGFTLPANLKNQSIT